MAFCIQCGGVVGGRPFARILCDTCELKILQQYQQKMQAAAQKAQQQAQSRYGSSFGVVSQRYQQQYHWSQGNPKMSPQTSCRIWWDASVSAYRLSSSFNKELVDTIKAQIPGSDRSFDQQSKIWTFTEKWLTPLLGFIKLLGVSPIVITRAQAEVAQTSSASGSTRGKSLDAVIIEFVKVLPYESARKAYRDAAMLLHPDRGGSMEKMSALNAAWERIQKEVFQQ